MAKEDCGTAYLRDVYRSGQCELSFSLNTEIHNLGKIDAELTAVRQVSDTVGSLIQHIQNKIRKLIKDKFYLDKENKDDQIIGDIPVSMTRGSNNIKPTMKLGNLSTSLTSGNGPVILKVYDNKFVMNHNAPLVKNIKIPSNFYVGFSTQPAKVQGLYIENQCSQFIWYKSLDKQNWVHVGDGYRYSVKQEDLGYYLKLMCIPVSAANVEGPSYEVISKNKVQEMAPLPSCPFEQRHEFTKKRCIDNDIRVVSYNVLAERYAEIDDNFTYCDPTYLAIDYRKQLIIKELLGYNADVICLQEVDSRHFISYYRDKMRDAGYIGIYNKKGDKIPEGLALFFNKHRFVKIETKHKVLSNDLQYNKLFSQTLNLLNKNDTVKQEFMRQSTSLQVTVLKNKQTKKFVMVANTHLFYHPDADHIRLLQVNMETTYLQWLRRKYQRNTEGISVIFCGDFNSSHNKSLFPYMIKGKLHPTHTDCMKINENGKTNLFHDFQWLSTYGTPKYTNYTPDYKGCLDYIFVDKTKIEVIQVVPLTEEEELEKTGGLPNEVYPSDHLALVVDLRLK